MTTYVPNAGDVVWLQFNPQAGHEQSGHTPAVVLSPTNYNSKTGLMLCCPVTSQAKGYPFEVPIAVKGAPSVVLADQIKSMDWRACGATQLDRIPSATLALILLKARALLQPSASP